MYESSRQKGVEDPRRVRKICGVGYNSELISRLQRFL